MATNSVGMSHEKWRRLVFERDGYRCVICGSEDNLQGDHILPVSKFPHLMRDVENGRTLCRSCHKKTDTYGGKQHRGKRVEKDPYGKGKKY